MASPSKVELDHIKVPKQVNSAMADFKKFALKGNVVDLAVGVIIGAAFGKIVTSLVEDIIMPPIGLLLGKVDFSDLYVNLSGQPFTSLAEAKKAGIPVIAYGVFLNALINFIIVAFAVFVMVRQLSKLQRGEEKAPTTHECPFCTSAVSVKATRCPNCTSEIPAVAAPLAPASEG